MPPPPVTLSEPSGSLNWWQSILLAGLSALAGVVAVIMVQSGIGVGGAATPNILFRYVPHFLLLFGLLADGFTYQGVYWTGTAAGLTGAVSGKVLDATFGGLMKMFSWLSAKAGRGPPPAPAPPTPIVPDGNYDGCQVSGVSANTVAVPPTLTITATVLWYFIIDLIDNVGWTGALGSMVAFLALYTAQATSISKCITPGSNGAIWGIVYGLLTGGAYYAIVKSTYPRFLPSSVLTVVANASTSASSATATLAAGETQSGGLRAGGASGNGKAPTSCSK